MHLISDFEMNFLWVQFISYCQWYFNAIKNIFLICLAKPFSLFFWFDQNKFSGPTNCQKNSKILTLFKIIVRYLSSDMSRKLFLNFYSKLMLFDAVLPKYGSQKKERSFSPPCLWAWLDVNSLIVPCNISWRSLQHLMCFSLHFSDSFICNQLASAENVFNLTRSLPTVCSLVWKNDLCNSRIHWVFFSWMTSEADVVCREKRHLMPRLLSSLCLHHCLIIPLLFQHSHLHHLYAPPSISLLDKGPAELKLGFEKVTFCASSPELVLCGTERR